MNKKHRVKLSPNIKSKKEVIKKVEENTEKIKQRKLFIEKRNDVSEKIVNLMIYLNAFNAATVRAEKIMQNFLESQDFTVVEPEGRKLLDNDMSVFIRVFFVREFATSMLGMSESAALDYAMKYVVESTTVNSKNKLISEIIKKGTNSKNSTDVSSLIGLVKGLTSKTEEFPYGKVK